jgi:hypothetical protein
MHTTADGRREVSRTRHIVVMALAVVGLLGAWGSSAQPCGPGQWLTGDQQGVPGVNGVVYAVVEWDPDGPGPRTPLLVVGGVFQYAGAVPASNIAAWDGEHWSPLGEGAETEVNALAVFGGELIAGTAISTLNGRSRAIARWDGARWASLGGGLTNGNTTGGVHALSGYNGDLIAGGIFSDADGQPVHNIARWDGTAWHSLGSGTAPYGYVHALAVYNGELVAGGDFSAIGGQQAAGVASWDGVTWRPLGAGLGGPSNLGAQALVVWRGSLVAGGYFSTAGGVPAENIAMWDGAAWRPLGAGIAHLSIVPTVLGLSAFGDALVACGRFTSAGGQPANAIARWDGAAWAPLGQGLQNSVFPAHGFALGVYAGSLVVGGDFQEAGGRGANGTSTWDGAEWQPLGDGTDNTVYAMTNHNGELVAGGDFTSIGHARANHVARWDGTDWRPLGSGVQGELYGTVMALASFQGELIAAGTLISAGGAPAAHIAAWNGKRWRTLGDGFGPTAAYVSSLAVFNGDLIAGGNFETAGGRAARNIARWDGVRWHALGEGVGGFSSAWVGALAEFDGALVAGGFFSMAGAGAARNIARWDGTRWSPLGAGLVQIVRALAVYRGELVAGGGPALSSSDVVNAWDGTSWRLLGGGVGGLQRPGVFGLTLYNGDLVAAGFFLTAGSAQALHIARWDGAAWQPFGTGLRSASYSLATFGDELIAGGTFTLAGGIPSGYWARWTEPAQPVVRVEPADALACPHGAAAFTVAATGGSLAYRWQRADGVGGWVPLDDGPTPGGSAIQGAFAAALQISGVTAADEGVYRVNVTNPCGTSVSRGAALRLCQADMDCSGALNVHDVLGFIAAYAAADPRADFDADGSVTISDFLVFLGAFAAGCS